MLAFVTLSVSVFSAIDIGGNALQATHSIGAFDSLPSHFRWGTAQSISAAQFYGARSAIGNVTGIEKAELRSYNAAYSYHQGVEFSIVAIPNGSIAYNGLTYVSGSRTPGPGQVIVIRNSQSTTILHMGQLIQANFTFLAYPVIHLNLVRNFTVAGFADLTLNGFGYLTNSRLTGPITNSTFSFTELVANWDDLMPSILDFVSSNKAEPPITEVFAYVKRSDFSGTLDVGSQLSRAQSIEGRVVTATSKFGGSTDSILTNELQGYAYQANIYSRVATYEGVLTVIASYPISEYATRRLPRKSRRDQHSDTGSPGTGPANYWDMGRNFLLKALLLELGGVLIGILAALLFVSVLISASLLWTVSGEGLSYSATYGVGLSIAVLFCVWQRMKNSRIKGMSLETGGSSTTTLRGALLSVMNDKLVSPGILGLAAAASSFAFAYVIWWNYTFVDPRPELDFLAIPFTWFLGGLGLLISYSGARSIIGTEHRANGRVVFVCSVLTCLFALPGLFRSFSLNDVLTFSGLILGSSLGIVGGLKGIYWERSWKDGAAVPGLPEYSRWALIGGLALVVVALLGNGCYSCYPDSLTLLLALIVPVSGWLVYKGVGNRRLLALMIIAGALWAINPLWLYYGVFRLNYEFFRLSYGFTIADILGFAGTVLSVIAGVKIWTSKANNDAPNNDSGPTMKPEGALEENKRTSTDPTRPEANLRTSPSRIVFGRFSWPIALCHHLGFPRTLTNTLPQPQNRFVKSSHNYER